MKYLGEVSYVLGIEIHRDRSRGTLGLSQKAYFERVLKKFNMHKCSPSPAPIVKGDKFGTFQCPRNQCETDQMKSVPYASAVGSIMYAQVCTCPDLCFITGMLGRYHLIQDRTTGRPQRKSCVICKELRISCLHIKELIT